ncbi:hypothetical protein HDU76_004566 [Blyttiomyces sp. JEL0837]|nr:hypothetical protein HDU76_004566 [Blyttiomyces sp. JEL0837]
MDTAYIEKIHAKDPVLIVAAQESKSSSQNGNNNNSEPWPDFEGIEEINIPINPDSLSVALRAARRAANGPEGSQRPNVSPKLINMDNEEEEEALDPLDVDTWSDLDLEEFQLPPEDPTMTDTLKAKLVGPPPPMMPGH